MIDACFEIDSADYFRSSSLGSVLERFITLFILLASRLQLDIPTVATLGGSRRLCITLRGL